MLRTIVALYSGEDFSRAKLLKQAIVDLQKVCVLQYTHVHSIHCTSLPVQVGEVLAQLVLEKQHAIETENYEMAEECKERTDRLRMHMYRQLDVFGLVEDTSVLGRHAVSGECEGTWLTSCEWGVGGHMAHLL